MAYQKYMYFAKIARKNGDEEIAQLFESTAKHETAHAEGHLRNLYPMAKLTTEDCLRIAMEGEFFEYSEMYPQYAKAAQEEGAEEWMIKEFQDGIDNTVQGNDFTEETRKVEDGLMDNMKKLLEKVRVDLINVFVKEVEFGQ